jgi:hypothetical protein
MFIRMVTFVAVGSITTCVSPEVSGQSFPARLGGTVTVYATACVPLWTGETGSGSVGDVPLFTTLDVFVLGETMLLLPPLLEHAPMIASRSVVNARNSTLRTNFHVIVLVLLGRSVHSR